MKVTWTNTFTADFDLDQAEEDFKCFRRWNFDKDYETTIYAAVESNLYFESDEIVDASPAIKQCVKALRQRIGGVQMKMELN